MILKHFLGEKIKFFAIKMHINNNMKNEILF